MFYHSNKKMNIRVKVKDQASDLGSTQGYVRPHCSSRGNSFIGFSTRNVSIG